MNPLTQDEKKLRLTPEDVEALKDGEELDWSHLIDGYTLTLSATENATGTDDLGSEQ